MYSMGRSEAAWCHTLRSQAGAGRLAAGCLGSHARTHGHATGPSHHTSSGPGWYRHRQVRRHKSATLPRAMSPPSPTSRTLPAGWDPGIPHMPPQVQRPRGTAIRAGERWRRWLLVSAPPWWLDACSWKLSPPRAPGSQPCLSQPTSTGGAALGPPRSGHRARATALGPPRSGHRASPACCQRAPTAIPRDDSRAIRSNPEQSSAIQRNQAQANVSWPLATMQSGASTRHLAPA